MDCELAMKLREGQGRLLVEIAFEAAVPFGGRPGNGESREEFRQRARRRRPIHLTERVDQILRGYVSPIHYYLSLIIGEKVRLEKEVRNELNQKVNETRKEGRRRRKVGNWKRVKKEKRKMKLSFLFSDWSSFVGLVL